MVHEKKILHQYFEPLQNGTKRFELRKEDGAPYQIGDEIILREWNEEEGYTGHQTRRMITYVLRDCPEYGLKEGYAILGLSDGSWDSWRSETREEKPMKVLREIETETDRLQVGDRIKVSYSGEEHYATAIEERGDRMLFLTDDYLDDAMPMNTDGTTEGGWEESFLREKLQDLAENTDIKDQLVPFENGDLLTLLSIQEMFGLDGHFDKCSGQIEWLKDRRHRIADRKGKLYEWGWLRSVVSAAGFALVGGDGFADGTGASGAVGVRPAFAIKI